jgi:pyruvate/2-oxoglutarate dehydrogenase complex dihydrolipoamide acyltransferase (E2) component
MSNRIEVTVPHENVNDPTAKLLDWKARAGTKVKAGEAIAEMENSKATFPVTAPAEGTIEYAREVGEEVPVGAVLCYLLSEAEAGVGVQAPVTSEPDKTSQPAPAPAAAPAEVVFSKAAQALMAQLRLDPALFAGMTFVKEADVRRKAGMAEKPEPKAAASKPEAPAPAAVLAVPKDEEIAERVPLERAKTVENRELLAADRAALKSTLFYLCPAEGLQAACARRSPPLPRLVVILFETARLLQKHRTLNACLVQNDALFYRHVHLGFAVDMGRGLKVLVIRKAEELSFAQLAESFDDLLVKYSTDSLSVADVTGSTFTVTDLGQEGVFGFVPLLNSNQAAILGIGAEEKRQGGFLLSCSFDHRLTGGRQVAEFMRELSRRVVCHARSLGAGSPDGSVVHCSRCLQTVEEVRALRGFLLPSVEPPGYICTNCLAGE